MRPFRWAALLALALQVVCLRAQTPQLSLDYLNPGLNPSHWELTLDPDGSGHFRSERNSSPSEPRRGIVAPEVDRPIQVEPAFAARLFQAAAGLKFSNEICEARAKVAFQGWKTLSYSAPDGQSSCRFNYSRDREIQSLTDALEAVAAAVLEGARLENLLQHDRLGLDREMDFLSEAVAGGRMVQLCTIRGILERIAADPGVIERVRKRASQLLVRAGAY